MWMLKVKVHPAAELRTEETSYSDSKYTIVEPQPLQRHPHYQTEMDQSNTEE